MAYNVARALFLSLLLGLGFVLADGPRIDLLGPPDRTEAASPWVDPRRHDAERVVFLAGKLSPEELVAFSTSLIGAGHPGVLLLNASKFDACQQRFLAAYQARRIVPVGTFPEGVADLERRLGVRAASAVTCVPGAPRELWQGLFARAERVVVCPAKPYRLLLQSACLAGILQAPLYVLHEDEGNADNLRRLLKAWGAETVFAVGSAADACRKIAPGTRVERLADEEAVAATYLRHQLQQGPVRTLVVANPADLEREAGQMSSLAPWITLKKRAFLLLTNRAGDDVADQVEAALKRYGLAAADTLLIAADLQAIPMERRPNPIAEGKDPYIEMEPLTPAGTDPYSFAVGRLFHEDPAIVPLVLARERLLGGTSSKGEKPRPRALVASNSAGSLPLLETFSRNTAKEMENRGYQTTMLLGSAVNPDELRRLMPAQDIFLWEGHHNTLIKEYGFAKWTEPLRPSLIFLQSCLALRDYKVQPLLERGAVGVVGSSTRIYSGSGGAFTLSFFDALLYEQNSLGGALRQAKNFQLAYALLKEKRLGGDARMTAANLRSAWSFTLWGDPTLHLPPPSAPEDALAPIRHKVHGNTISLLLPDSPHEKAVTSKYRAQMMPNGRLAGLLCKDPEEEGPCLVPLVFAEVELPSAPAGKTPRLHSRLPASNWVFCWDGRRRTGFLLVKPRAKDSGALRFHIDWESPETAQRGLGPQPIR